MAQQASPSALWFVTIVINTVLATWDEKKLKAAGHDTLGMGAAWIVPVYLYKRARVLRQSNGYFVVWCVTFALFVFM